MVASFSGLQGYILGSWGTLGKPCFCLEMMMFDSRVTGLTQCGCKEKQEGVMMGFSFSLGRCHPELQSVSRLCSGSAISSPHLYWLLRQATGQPFYAKA